MQRLEHDDDWGLWLQIVSMHGCKGASLEEALDEDTDSDGLGMLRGFETGKAVYLGSETKGYVRLFPDVSRMLLDTSRRKQRCWTPEALPLVAAALDREIILPVARLHKDLRIAIAGAGIASMQYTPLFTRDHGYHKTKDTTQPAYIYSPDLPISRIVEEFNRHQAS